MRHAPARSRANSWEDVSDLSASFGIVLDEWQEVVLQAAMGERSDGRWATPQVALSTPRQNGKSQLIVARALAGILLFGEELIIVSAHQQDTAREVFGRLVDILEQNPRLDERVETYGKALNREYIRFKTGQTIRFKARSAGGGRGFSCDCLLLDEAQILGAPAWAAILPTMSARPNPQVWLFGTPPTPQDDGEVFTRLREAGIEGKSSRLAYLEWSAEPEDDFDAEATWAKANPSFGTRIGHDAIMGERLAMSDEQFAMERLGIWSATGSNKPLIDFDAQWSPLHVQIAPPSGVVAYGVKFSADGARVALAAARRPTSGRTHIEVVKAASTAAGTGWLVDWLHTRWRGAAAIVIDGRTGAGPLVTALRHRGVPQRRLVTPTTAQVIEAHAGLLEAVRTGALSHYGQTGLDDVVKAATKRAIGDKAAGGWGWAPIGDDIDITPLDAATYAHFGATTTKRRSTDSERAPSGRRAGVA